MKRELLGELLAARRRKEPAVLVRGLTNGTHCVVTRQESLGDVDDIDPAIVDAARAALDSDGARTLEAAGERLNNRSSDSVFPSLGLDVDHVKSKTVLVD